MIALVVASAVLAACDGSWRANAAPATTLPTERCGNHVQTDFDPRLEWRTLIAGPVAMVPSRVTPVPGGMSPARNFKLAVRLDAKADAILPTKTLGTSLMCDRARAQEDNVYRLADGTRSVRLTGCPDQTALFVGAVLTTENRGRRGDHQGTTHSGEAHGLRGVAGHTSLGSTTCATKVEQPGSWRTRGCWT